MTDNISLFVIISSLRLNVLAPNTIISILVGDKYRMVYNLYKIIINIYANVLTPNTETLAFIVFLVD